jgi:AcrR family transcriptional regulator
MANERMSADERTKQLTQVGYEIARTKGIRKVTRAEVARRTSVSDGLLNRYFGGREGLRAAVLALAIEKKDAQTLADASEHYELPSMPQVLERAIRKLVKP